MLIKVILVDEDIETLEGMLNDGWKVDASFTHPQGVLMFMVKQVMAINNKRG